jgi:hypothetical protein
MADIVNSLFGLPSEDVRQQLYQQQQDFSTQYANTYGNEYDKRNALLGGRVGNAVANLGAGIFGVQDPRLKRATTLESILQTTQQELGENVNNPAVLYPALQQRLAEAGFSREAMQVGQVGQKAMQEAQLNQVKTETEVAQGQKFKAEALKALREDDPKQKLFFELAKNASPQSVARAVNAGYDLGMLDSPEKTKYSPLAQQLIDAGFPYGTPEFNAKMIELIDAEKSGKAKGSGNVSVNLGGIAIDSGKISEEAGKIVGKDVGGIQDTYAQLEDFQNAKNMLKAGIFAGPYGPVEMQVAKKTRQNLSKVANTEKFKSYIASNVIKRLKDIGGNDTQEERAYLESMVGGDITFEPEAILSVIESGESKIRDRIARTSQQVESAGKGTPISVKPLLKDGQSGVSKSGKPMVVRNGKWEYK